MNKKIKIKMNENRDIVISVNDDEKITIKKDNRKIQANEIFGLLSYSNGDNFSVEAINEKEYDVPVLQFFCELLVDIVEKLKTEGTTGDKTNPNLSESECPF